MGFGYNPNLVREGERLDLLDFFAWMKRVQKATGSEWTIWDASGYYIVNRTPAEKIRKLGGRPTGKQILEVLAEEQERPKRREIAEACDRRSLYLQRALEISGVQGQYLDSRRIFREDERYAEAVDVALEFVERLSREEPELVKKIQPLNANPVSQLYLPLEIAEAFYLKYSYGIGGKFGPASEEGFDTAILQLLEEWQEPYLAVRCPLDYRKAGYLTDENVITTSMSPKEITLLLAKDRRYGSFVEEYLAEFRKEGESLLEVIPRLQSQLGGEPQ